MNIKQIGRVWRSAGPTTAWSHKLGHGKRALLLATKAIDLGLTCLSVKPEGKILERHRSDLFGQQTLEVARPDELEQVAQILKIRDHDFTPPLTQRAEFGSLNEFVKQKFEKGEWIVAKRKAIVVGVMYAIKQQEKCRLGCIAVHPQLGKGAGAGMLRLGVERARGMKASAVFMSTSSNSSSIPLLAEYNPVITERIKDARSPGIDEIWWKIKL
jgi:hypothetical protein